jgi:signal transduction histidine kinase
LPLSRRFLELHGGTLTLESIVHRGTTVTITLPAARLVARQPQSAAA